MTDILNAGKTALFAFQRALATTSHNIANVNTEGYSRQRIDLEAIPGNSALPNQPGAGVWVSGIQRMNDQYASARVNSATSAYEEQNAYQAMASRLDNMVASEGSSVAPALSNFFNALQDANADPSSVSTREVVLDRAEELARRFQGMQQQFNDTQLEVNERIRGAVGTVSELAQSIADINKRVIGVSGSNSDAANDLLDQRDRLVNELSRHIDVGTTIQSDGAMNIFIGQGFGLVVSGVAQEMSVALDDTHADRLKVQIGKPGQEQTVSTLLQGGEIGGLSEFAAQTLQPAMAELGRLALTVADAANAQHALGIDMNGNAGTALFELGSPQVYSSSRNSGDGVISAQISNASELQASDYLLRFDGSEFTATRSSDGQQTSGALPLDLDGLLLSVSGSPVAGDTFTVSATGHAAGSMKSVLGTAEELALAGKLTTSSNMGNTGESRISSAKVMDNDGASLTDTIDIVFTSETSYDIVDAGTGSVLSSGSGYEKGEAIQFNGWEVSVNGEIHSGDTHRIEANLTGVGNNSNGLALSEMQDSLLVAGNQTFNDAYGTLVTRVGAQTNTAQTRATALESLRDSAFDRQQSVQAVSLDEEAVNLTRFQQAYQASAQIIAAADEMFQTILGAVR